MSKWPEWKPISDEAKRGGVLLYANIPPVTGGNGTLLLGYDRPQIVSGYWDEIDEAWCTTVSTVFGPFVEPLAWLPLPPAPEGGE